MRRSALVKVPSFSRKDEPGRNTCAYWAVSLRKMSCTTTHCMALSESITCWVLGSLCTMSMQCVVVQDIFLNETAQYAHVFLPGSSFLEKDGTFTNAERRISRVRKVMPPKAGYADWEVTQKLAN